MANSQQHTPTPLGSDHGTLTTYIVGFVLSVLLTLAAFAVVGYGILSGTVAIIVIVALALLQLFVQLRFFLHMSANSKARWNLMTFIFTAIIVLILVFGSIWIMVNINYHMMSH